MKLAVIAPFEATRPVGEPTASGQVGVGHRDGVCARVALIQTQPVQEIRTQHRAVVPGDFAEPVVQQPALRPAHGLAASPVEGVVDVGDRNADGHGGEPVSYTEV